MTLALLAVLAVGSLAYAVAEFRTERRADRQRIRHLERMLTDAYRQRDEARAERDEALDFADESAILLGLAARDDAKRRHPSVRLAVVK